MEVNSTVFTTNFQHNNYIYNCDFVNKYAIKSIYKTPKIQKIVIRFSIDQIKKSEISENDRIVSLKSFFILYTLFFLSLFVVILYLKINELKSKMLTKKLI